MKPARRYDVARTQSDGRYWAGPNFGEVPWGDYYALVPAQGTCEAATSEKAHAPWDVERVPTRE